jgi:hypothetical protein
MKFLKGEFLPLYMIMSFFDFLFFAFRPIESLDNDFLILSFLLKDGWCLNFVDEGIAHVVRYFLIAFPTLSEHPSDGVDIRAIF